MTVEFYKYQGTGNDFVIIDNRRYNLSKNDTKTIKLLCDRRFGIGADGLIFLENSGIEGEDFKMVYFNSDGNESTMCGNGGRCLVSFAHYLNIFEKETLFSAIDGQHEASISNGVVSLKMQDVSNIETLENALYLNTGSPHYVTLTSDILNKNIKVDGAAIRYNDRFKKEGTNVNFVEPITANLYRVRTYERGVEDETLSCGTGVTAVAIAMHALSKTDKNSVDLKVQGGSLNVAFNANNGTYTNVWLTGPAEQVFKGEVSW
jgi:diaminopimelate epimerase